MPLPFKFKWLLHPTHTYTPTGTHRCMCTHLHKFLRIIKDLGVLCKCAQKSFNHRKSLVGCHENHVFWTCSSSVSCLACLSLPLSVSLSVSPAVSQAGYCTSGGECMKCQISGNILKMQEFKIVSADCFMDNSISGSSSVAALCSRANSNNPVYPCNTVQL